MNPRDLGRGVVAVSTESSFYTLELFGAASEHVLSDDEMSSHSENISGLKFYKYNGYINCIVQVMMLCASNVTTASSKWLLRTVGPPGEGQSTEKAAVLHKRNFSIKTDIPET